MYLVLNTLYLSTLYLAAYLTPCSRYHKEERVWITRAPGMAPSEKTTTYERGTYYFFDVNSWRKVDGDGDGEET